MENKYKSHIIYSKIVYIWDIKQTLLTLLILNDLKLQLEISVILKFKNDRIIKLYCYEK